ncbi:MAG: extracellular solute-binding protein [Anaerolineae bacterium]|nr:extracellular solute-binding protein [Anaerolineae bacterium]
MFSKRISITLLLCLLFLTACKRSGADDSPLQSTVSPVTTTFTTITLAVAEANLSGYRPLIEQFEAQHSHIRVRLVAESEIVSTEEPDRIAALASSADLFAYSPTIHENQQYLLDLRPLLNADPTFDVNDFLPGLLDSEDSMWSLSVAASYPLIFFDKTAFDAAGLAYPEPGWTLDEFLAAARALTRWEGDEVVQWGYVPFQVQPLLATQLAAPLVVNGQPRLTDPDVADALQWLADLFTLHEVSPWLENYKPPALQEAGGPDPISLVREGWAAMWSADHTVWQFGFADENIGLTTIPRSQQGYAADAVRYGFAISRGTAQPQAAWALLTFLSQQPPVDSLIDMLLPARRSVAAADGFWNRVPAVMVDPLQYAANNNTILRFTPAGVDTMRGALTAVITDNQPVPDALDQARAMGAGQPVVAEADTPLVVAAPPDEPTTNAEPLIEILFATTVNETPVHQELAKVFNQEQSYIRVTVRHLEPGQNVHGRITGVDCFTGSAANIVNTQTASLIRSLDPLFELDPELNPDDFYTTTTAVLTQQGQLLGLPAWIRIPLIQYNRELFAVAGVPPPPLDWTLNEFLQTAQALTDPALEQYGYIDWYLLSPFSFGPAQFGVKLIDNSENAATIDFAAAAPILGWHVDMVAHYGVHPVLPGNLKFWDDFSIRSDLFHELVQNGKVAMWPVEWRGGTEDRLTGDLEIGSAPMPRGPHGYSFSLVDNLVAYFISTETLHVQACWQWLKFLSIQPTASPYLPAHIATAQSAAFADHVGAKLADVYLTAVAGGSHEAFLTGQLEEWINPGLVWLVEAAEIAAKGGVTLASTLADAEDKFTRYRACVMNRQAFDNRSAWRECAIQVDPDLAQRY